MQPAAAFEPGGVQLVRAQVRGRAATQGHDPGGDVGSLAAGADHGVPVDVAIRLDQTIEPHDHIQQDVADHADPPPGRVRAATPHGGGASPPVAVAGALAGKGTGAVSSRGGRRCTHRVACS